MFNEQFKKVSDANSSMLAEYVAHRKIVIDFLNFAIRQKDDGKFEKESYIHNLIYPMKHSADEMEYSAHNLWLIDEKLSYCSYIASDIPFGAKSENGRTDLLFLDKPVAMANSENDGTEFNSIIVFEFKRPMRNDYSRNENPVDQLLEYVETLRSGKATDKDGRPILVSENTQFYLYAICDLTPTLRAIMDRNSYNQTPDKQGYYHYHTKYNAYIEVISFDKIINDSKLRNRVLFDKLGL